MAGAILSPMPTTSSRATFSLYDTDDHWSAQSMHKTGSQTPVFAPHRDYTIDAELESFHLGSTRQPEPMSEAQAQLARLRIYSDEISGEEDTDSDSSLSASAIFEQVSAASSPASSPAPSPSPAASCLKPLGLRPVPLQRTISASMVRSYSNPVPTQAEVDAWRRNWSTSGDSTPSALAPPSPPPRAKSSDDLTPRSSVEELRYPYRLAQSSSTMAARLASGSVNGVNATSTSLARPHLGRFHSFEPSTLHRSDSWAN